MEPDMLTISDLLRRGYFTSEQMVRINVRRRKFPPPVSVGNRKLWPRTTVERWIANRSIIWIPRSNKNVA